MKKFDWIKPIKETFFLLKITGLWPEEIEGYTLNLYSLWSFICITAFTFAHPFFQVIKIFFIINDLDALVSVIYITLEEFLISIKAFLFVRNIKILKKLMQILSSESFQPRNDKQVEVLKSYLELWKKYINVFWMIAVVAVFFTISYPIFDNSYKEYRLPFMAWYPVNVEKSPNYEIAYLHQLVGLSFCACTAVSIDTLMFAIYVYMKAQFDVLCDELKHFCDFEGPKHARRRLLNCVNHYRIILRFAKDFEEFSSWIIFGQFFVSAISIGLTMFQLTTVDPFSTEFFSLFTFLMAISIEIFIYCWFGNEVEVASRCIPYAIFESSWLNTSLEIKRYMIIFVERSQKPLKISALNLFYLSLETYVKILRASWSYFALLNSIKK